MNKKKLLAVLLSLSMIGSVIGIPVYADEYDNETIAVGTEIINEIPEETMADTEEFVSDVSVETDIEEIELLSVDDGITLFADTVSYPIEKDQTFSFENLDIVAQNITGLSNYIDYVIYYKDSSVQEYKANSRPSTLSVPAGGRIIITSTDKTVNAAIADDYFLVEEEVNPVFHKVELELYETYTYTNTSNVAFQVISRYSNTTTVSGYEYDYVLYDADGNVSKYTENTSSDIEVPAGYSLKITQTGNRGQELNGLYDKFDLVKNDEPVMKKVKITAGETYTYANTGNVAFQMISRYSNTTTISGYEYDYVLYDADGNVSKYAENTSSDIEVPAGHSLKITQTGNRGQELNGLYDKFDLVKNDEPVMKKVQISAGETYTYTNTSNVAFQMISRYNNTTTISGYEYDYVLSDADGNVSKYAENTSSDIEVPAGYSLKITQTGNRGQELNGLYEYFDVTNNNVSMPTYKIINTDTIDATLSLKSGYSYDYAVYDANNTLYNYDVSSTAKVTIPKGGYAIVTVNTNSTSPFEENSVLNISEYINPVYRVTYLNPDETYKYTNTGSRELKVYKNGLSCDYVIHNADGSISSYATNSTDASFTVPVGGNICITSHNYIHIKGLYDYVTVEKIDGNVFDIAFCSLGETYQFTNNAVKDISIFTSSSVYDYVIYNADNSVNKEAVNVTSTSIVVPAGCKFVMTSQVSNISIYALKEAFSEISQRSYPVMKRTSVYFGEPVSIFNAVNENRTLYALNSNYINYTTFDVGNNPQDAKELVSPSSINVPANGRADITARASNVTFAGLYEAFADGDFGVKVTGITLSNDRLALAPGGQSVLRATVMPTDATNKNVIWSSSNTSVATVAQTGKVTAKSAGTAVITVTTADGGFTASCTVTVSGGSDTPTTPTPGGDTPEPIDYPYSIDRLAIETESGNTLSSPPQNQAFIVSVDFTKLKTRNAKDYIFVAVYDINGALLSLDYAKANFSETGEYSIGFHVPAQSVRIGEVKAFVWNTFNSMEPLAESKSIY